MQSIQPDKYPIIFISLVLITAIITIIYYPHPTIKTEQPEQSGYRLDECYFKSGSDPCIILDEIAFINKDAINTLCNQMNCTNQSDYRRALAMIIIENDLQNKKLILIDDHSRTSIQPEKQNSTYYFNYSSKVPPLQYLKNKTLIQ